MSPAINIDFDDDAGVLYIKRRASRPKMGRQTPYDPGIVLSLNKDGKVVGAIITGADSIEKEYWKNFQGRELFPEDILAALDRWIDTR